jgi:uncharacterized membrane protein
MITAGISSAFRNRKAFFLLSLVFGLLYSLISLVNHYNFRTHALDLGLYTNALYDYAHLQMSNSQVMMEQPQNLLGDHFDLLLMLLSPLWYLFGTYTLLIVQILAILAGGYFIYRYILETLGDKKLALLAAACLYSFYGVFSAISFDYHSNVVAAMLVPAFFLFVHRGQWIKAVFIFLLILVSKENMALWMLFVALGLAWHYRKDPPRFKACLLFAFLAIAWFVTVTGWIMPAFAASGKYAHMDYHVLGSNLKEAFANIFRHPLVLIQNLFQNHSGDPSADYVKTELHLFVFFSGGFLLLFSPEYLLMLVPIYFQKLLHDNTGIWGLAGQYSIEFAPILIAGSFFTISKLKDEKKRLRLSLLLFVLIVSLTVHSFDNTVCFFDRAKQRFYQAEHYQRAFDVSEAYKALKLIPDDAEVSAHSHFLPHLAGRKAIHQFPIILNASYIIISTCDSPYPISEKEFNNRVNDLKTSPTWHLIYDQNHILIFKRT